MKKKKSEEIIAKFAYETTDLFRDIFGIPKEEKRKIRARIREALKKSLKNE